MSELAAGYGEKVITPRLGADLTGYGYYLDRKAESVLDDLKVRALFLRTEAVGVVLVSCDLIGLAVEFSDAIRKEVASDQGLAPENILLGCTHTHSGPATVPLIALGEPEPDYLAGVAGAVKEAVRLAAADQHEAEFSYQIETVEPIGFNRRKRNFDPIDPTLKVAVFKRSDKKIYLLSYACHAVILGPTKQVSADWPGALAREIEASGGQAIVLQGFCGDIDPVTNWNRWGKGTKEDLAFCGRLLAQRAFKAEEYAASSANPTLKVAEQRVDLPLKIPSRAAITKEKDAWLETHKASSPMGRFIEEWAAKATEAHAEFSNKPCLAGIPIQGVSIGGLRMLGLPGEVFCEYGLRLRERWAPLFTLGYCGGDVGYLPTTSAYQVPNDYACYGSARFYALFPFTPEIEDVVLGAANEVLAAIAQAP